MKITEAPAQLALHDSRFKISLNYLILCFRDHAHLQLPDEVVL